MKRLKPQPMFVSKTEIATHLCVSGSATIDTWIVEGRFPPPHSQPGKRHSLWLRRHWDAYVATGSWPREAFPHA